MSGDVWRRNLTVLWTGQYISTAGLTVVVPFLPFYMEQLGVEGSARQLWAGVALSAPAVTLALAAPLWGRLGDQHGRKLMVVRALFGIGVSMLLMGLATGPLQFVVYRLAQGAFGGVVDAAAAFAGAATPSEGRGRALGQLQTATAAGALTGPLAGGVLADTIGLRAALLAAAALTVASGLVAAAVLDEPRRVAPVASVSRPKPQAIRELVRSPVARAFLLSGLAASTSVYALIVVFAPHVRGLLDNPQHAGSWVGSLQAVTWAASIVGALWWGKRNDFGRVERNLMVAMVGGAVAVGLQAVVTPVGALVPIRLAQGFFFSAVAPCLFLEVSRSAGEDHQGAYLGTANSVLVVGRILGGLVGALVSSLISTSASIAVIAAVFGLGIIAASAAVHSGRGR